jgi:hypothetical protein
LAQTQSSAKVNKKDWTEKKALQITTGGIRAGQGKSPFSSLTFLIMEVA